MISTITPFVDSQDAGPWASPETKHPETKHPETKQPERSASADSAWCVGPSITQQRDHPVRRKPTDSGESHGYELSHPTCSWVVREHGWDATVACDIRDCETSSSRVALPALQVETLLKTLWESPRDLSDSVSLWPRYSTQSTLDSPDAWQLSSSHVGAEENAVASISIDFIAQRVSYHPQSLQGCVGSNYLAARSALQVPIENALQGLPHWWIVVSETPALASRRKRLQPMPNTYRRLLWGELLTQWIADEVLHQPVGEEVLGQNHATQSPAMSAARLHRMWLHSRFSELGNQTPQECLVAGRDWLGKLIDFQVKRSEQGYRLHPIPESMVNFDRSAVGLQEMIMYFDACQFLIEHAIAEKTQSLRNGAALCPMELAAELQSELALWLLRPNAFGEIPGETIRAEQLRLPTYAVPSQHFPVPLLHGEAHPTAHNAGPAQGEWLAHAPQFSAGLEGNHVSEEEPPGRTQATEQRTRWIQPRTTRIAEDHFHPLALGFELATITSVLQDCKANQREIDELSGAYAAYRYAGEADAHRSTKNLICILQRLRFNHPVIALHAERAKRRIENRQSGKSTRRIRKPR